MLSKEKIWEWELEEKFDIYERIERLHSWRLVEDKARKVFIIQNSTTPPASYAGKTKTMWLALIDENQKIKFFKAKRVR